MSAFKSWEAWGMALRCMAVPASPLVSLLYPYQVHGWRRSSSLRALHEGRSHSVSGAEQHLPNPSTPVSRGTLEHPSRLIFEGTNEILRLFVALNCIRVSPLLAVASLRVKC